jgi:xylulokinase
MSLMGVDVGTTAVKAAVFSESGRLLAAASREYPLLFPLPGASELDSRAVTDAALAVIGETASLVAATDPVAAIGIASQGEAFTPLALDGAFLANAMTSGDTRSAPLVESWSREFGRERMYEITGHTCYPMYSLFKLLWLKENEPEVWERAHKFLFFEDLLAYILTGETATDPSMAARSMLFDVTKRRWSDEILGALALSPDRLARVVPSGTVVGTVSAEPADSLGLDMDVAVFVAGHDQPVGALGCGAAVPGSASYAIGTVECVCPAIARLILSPDLMRANLATYPHVLPDTYTTVAFNMTGGSVLRWLRDTLAHKEVEQARTDGADPYDRIVAAAAPEPAKLLLLPHFGPTGTPRFDPEGAGALLGLTLSTTRAEIFRAFLEGITYEMKWNLSILAASGFELSELRAVGGGSRSPVWMQIKADILGLPLTVMQVSEATCAGAAILAGAGMRLFEPREVAALWAKPARTFLPRPEYRRGYEDRFAIYQEAYRALGSARRALHSLKAGR